MDLKSIVKDKRCDEILSVFNEIKCFRIPSSYGSDDNQVVIDRSKVHTYVMSDSICIWVELACNQALFTLMFLCLDLQKRMLEMDPPVLLRGAITKGEIFHDDDILFGPGVVEAYLMESRCACVPRIIINKSLITEHIEENGEFPPFYFEDYDCFYSIDYINFYNQFSKHEKMEPLENRLEYVNYILSTTIDSSIREKLLYVKKRMEYYCIQNKMENE